MPQSDIIVIFYDFPRRKVSRIADLIRPRQASMFHGLPPFDPDTRELSESNTTNKETQTLAQTPSMPLKTIGQVMSPPDI